MLVTPTLCPDQKSREIHKIECERRMLMAHPVYTSIHSIDELHVFMQHHVFAVWDFMSLLKALQRALSCVTLPWIPVGSPDTRRLINEIVLLEETDEDGNGGFASHFELYLDAMRQAGADTRAIDNFIQRIRGQEGVHEALKDSPAPPAASRFVQQTFDVIGSGELHRIAACFTFGREDIIPEMFQTLVKELRKGNTVRLERLIYYLDRHIKIDSDSHGPMAYEMIAAICGDSTVKWQEAVETAISALRSRALFWDSVLEAIHRHRVFAAADRPLVAHSDASHLAKN